MPSIQNTVVDIENVGPVLFRTDKRCSRLSIRVKPFEGVSVTFPPGYSIKSALAFVNEKSSWIQKSIQKMEKKEELKTIFNEETQFSSRSFTLKIQKADRLDVRLHLQNKILTVYYPGHLEVTDTPIQEAIRFGIEESMRREAKRYLPLRLNELAKECNFSYNKVFVKNLKSRWGSCSSVNNINLNLHLMRLPNHLIDYVMLHELCHVKEKNHGPRFWRLLDSFTNNHAKKLAREMKQYRTTIY
jgi:predicted metal-dependent hydrolase